MDETPRQTDSGIEIKPLYSAEDLAQFERLFPGRAVRGVPAKVLLEEGGTVHCITQQEPLGTVAAGTP